MRGLAKTIPVNIETAAIDYWVAMAIYEGSDGEATKVLYARLEALGPAGMIAMNLYRAHKASSRAKAYRGGNAKGSWKSQAYQKKAWSLDLLAKALDRDGAGLTWGWGIDVAEQSSNNIVFYVDLPTGQVSFHTSARTVGPDYPGKWDGIPRQGQSRICRWVEQLFKAPPPARPYRLPPGECAYCDEHRNDSMMPSHTASRGCESGKRPHCTCSTCF